MSQSKGIVQIEVTSKNIRTDTHSFYMKENLIQSPQKFAFLFEDKGNSPNRNISR